MKKLLVALSVASLFAGSAVANVEELTTEDPTSHEFIGSVVKNGQIQFNGQLLAPTCSIVSDDQNQVVNLETILTTDLGQVDTKKPFKVSLEKCPNVNKLVSLHFNVDENNRDGAHLKNTFSGNKADVSLKISSGEGLIDLSKPSGEQGVESKNLSSSQELEYNFTVEYVKASNVTGEVNPGAVQATLPFTVIYK
ncbi:fimbrial protein [Ursidibacter arcticus]